MRYFIEIAYKGSSYHGWQIQPNATAVQELLDKVLSVFCAEPIETLGCGRTDTGVHALQFFAHFDSQKEISQQHTQNLNGMLPFDIAVKKIFRVEDTAHARFDATERAYQYFIHFDKNPFLQDTSYALLARRDFDMEVMNHCAALLLNQTDFACFCKAGANSHTTLCDVREAFWKELDNGQWRFQIRADRFLRNMVRAIVGTLLDVGAGKISEEDFVQIINSKNRSEAGTSVPACGLFLTEVHYSYIKR